MVLMLASVRRHIRQQLVGYVALLFALGLGSAWAATELTRNDVKSKHIGPGQVKTSDLANDAVNSAKVGNGALLAEDFAAGQLPAGAQGQKGEKGDRGPSFGDGSRFENTNDIACDQDVVVGSQTLTLTEPSRIWVEGHGALSREGSEATVLSLWVQLRNASDTLTLAHSTDTWDVFDEGPQDVEALSTGGIMFAGDDHNDAGPVFVAPAGTYILQLAVTAESNSGCTELPNVGYNNANGLGYLLVGTG